MSALKRMRVNMHRLVKQVNNQC